MKKISTIFFAIILLCSGCQNKSAEIRMAKGIFLKDTFDFQTILKGDRAAIVFTLQNTGNENLVIKNTSVGCGCTTISSLKDTIAPGTSMNLKFIYNSKEDSGRILKTVVVETNTDPKLHVLYIKGIVE